MTMEGKSIPSISSHSESDEPARKGSVRPYVKKSTTPRVETSSSVPPVQQQGSSSESDEDVLLTSYTTPKTRFIQYVKKSTTPRVETSSSVPPARQQKRKIAESTMESTSTSPRPISSSSESDEDEPTTKKRMVQDAKKSTKPRAGKSSSAPPARQQKNKISGLQGLSVDQLINLIDTIIGKHPEIKNEVVQLIPLPDLSQFENKLEALKKNIDKSFPWSKFGSGRNAFCYQRVKTHLDTFQTECIQQCKSLIDYEQWNTVIDYALIAFKYVNQLPEWDESKHNKHKPDCYKKIMLHLVNAFKKGTFEKQKLEGFITRFKKLAEDGQNDSGMQNVIKLAETTLNKL